MKTKSNIVIPKGATHVNIVDGDKRGRLDIETFSLQVLADLQEMGTSAEFVCITGKGKRAKSEVLGTVLLTDGNAESTPANIQLDVARSAGETVLQDDPNVKEYVQPEIPDELTATKESHAWNLHGHEVPEIKLREASNVLNRFEYVQTPLLTSKGQRTGFKIAECSDNGLPVGRPYAKSYGLINNNSFIGLVESFGKVLDGLGLKWSTVTTGTLMDRERQFITIKIEQAESLKLGKREFRQFLSFLNSIASNAGCTLTINNTSFCVCCRNTFGHALLCDDGTPFYFGGKHTANLKDYIKDLPYVFDAFSKSNGELFKTLKGFNDVGITSTEAEQIFTAFITRDENKGELDAKGELSTRSFNMVERLKVLFAKGQGNDGQTALDVFSAVTEYYTHESAGESENKTKQLQSSEIGSGARAKRTMFSWLVQSIQDKSRFQAILKLGDQIFVAYAKGAKK